MSYIEKVFVKKIKFIKIMNEGIKNNVQVVAHSQPEKFFVNSDVVNACLVNEIAEKVAKG